MSAVQDGASLRIIGETGCWIQGVSPKSALVSAGVWVGDAFGRLSEVAWARIELLCRRQKGGLVRRVTIARWLRRSFFRYRTGVAWRDLPERFGPWHIFWDNGTAVRGAPPLREEGVRPQRTKKGKESTHSLPLQV